MLGVLALPLLVPLFLLPADWNESLQSCDFSSVGHDLARRGRTCDRSSATR